MSNEQDLIKQGQDAPQVIVEDRRDFFGERYTAMKLQGNRPPQVSEFAYLVTEAITPPARLQAFIADALLWGSASAFGFSLAPAAVTLAFLNGLPVVPFYVFCIVVGLGIGAFLRYLKGVVPAASRVVFYRLVLITLGALVAML